MDLAEYIKLNCKKMDETEGEEIAKIIKNIDVFQKNKKKEALKMHTIKLTREEAEELAKYIEVNKKVKLEHEQGEFELYLLRLEKILEKYKTSKNQDGIDVDETEFKAFAIYQRW